jgi:hypothetical protein
MYLGPKRQLSFGPTGLCIVIILPPSLPSSIIPSPCCLPLLMSSLSLSSLCGAGANIVMLGLVSRRLPLLVVFHKLKYEEIDLVLMKPRNKQQKNSSRAQMMVNVVWAHVASEIGCLQPLGWSCWHGQVGVSVGVVRRGVRWWRWQHR